jgi:nucleoredoxin
MLRLVAVLWLCLGATLSTAADFNWKTRFPEGLVNAEGKPMELDGLKGKVVAVYFSAHWCPPCRTFTPELVKFAHENQAKLAVVFVGCDRTPAQMFAYMKEAKMPWGAVPFKPMTDQALIKENDVKAIPTMVIFGKDGKWLRKDHGDLVALAKLLAE